MFWTIVAAILFVFIGIPIIIRLGLLSWIWGKDITRIGSQLIPDWFKGTVAIIFLILFIIIAFKVHFMGL